MHVLSVPAAVGNDEVFRLVRAALVHGPLPGFVLPFEDLRALAARGSCKVLDFSFALNAVPSAVNDLGVDGVSGVQGRVCLGLCGWGGWSPSIGAPCGAAGIYATSHHARIVTMSSHKPCAMNGICTSSNHHTGV